MGNFRALKARQVWRILLETTGPRTAKDQQAFRKALLALIRQHGTAIVGYRARISPQKKKAPRRRR